ncbi:MAG: ABC transporter ATP-binding protein, partial [Oscillospiraceae bacterium]|nr:ABC transporter ATP-binding protein [Oscillospiraceae bacterium]
MTKQTRSEQRESLKRVLKALSQYRGYLVLTLVLAIITVGLTLLVPILVGKAIDNIVEAGNVDLSAVTRILVTVGISVIVTAGAQWVMTSLNNMLTFAVVRDIRSRAFAVLMHLPLSYPDSHPT